MRRRALTPLAFLPILLLGCSDPPTMPVVDAPTAEAKPDKPGKPGGGDPGADAASPVIAYGSGRSGARSISVMDADGEHRTEIYVGQTFLHPSWSPLGAGSAADPYRVLVSGTVNGFQPLVWVEIFVDGGEPTAGGVSVLTADMAHVNAQVSPDGQQVAAVFVGTPPDFTDAAVVVSNSDVWDPVTVFSSPGLYPVRPAWSPDGSTLGFFTSDYDTLEFRMVFLDLATGVATDGFVTGFPDYGARGLDWSPNGDELVYDWNGQVHRVSLEGDLLEAPWDGIAPRYSADGTQIVYTDFDRVYLKTLGARGKDARLTGGQWPDWRR